MSSIWHGLLEAFWMFYQTFWALVLGFTLSGLVQAFVSRQKIAQTLGDHSGRSVTKATFFGAISSSCSYAASALAHSLYKKGADFTSSMIFMFASTNLVLDLGLVIWRLLGWQFALAEIFGGIVMSFLLWATLPRLFPKRKIIQLPVLGQSEEVTTKSSLADAAGFTVGDFTMMRFELLAGFVVAGLLSAIVPTHIWSAFFLHGHGFETQVVDVIVGPIIATLTFVCSVGNVPLAAALWHNGISFGGVISFIFADLLSFPLLLIYKKYYGLSTAIKLFFTFWSVMAVSGLAIELIFQALGIDPTIRALRIGSEQFRWDSTALLNSVALVASVAIYLLYRRNIGKNSEFAIDLICGMQVRKSDAPAHALINGVNYYFCMDGCRTDYLRRLAREEK